jgi:hypothetical protein
VKESGRVEALEKPHSKEFRIGPLEGFETAPIAPLIEPLRDERHIRERHRLVIAPDLPVRGREL